MYGLTSFLLTNILSVSTLLSSKSVLLNMYGLIPSMCIWTCGAVICCIFGLCYAELGSAYPSGNEQIFLTKAYNEYVGIAFVVSSVFIILPAYTGVFVNVIHDLVIDYSSSFVVNMGVCLFILILVYASGNLFLINRILFLINNGIVVIFFLSAVYAIIVYSSKDTAYAEKCAFYDTRGGIEFKGVSSSMLYAIWGFDGWSRGTSMCQKIHRQWFTLRCSIIFSILISLIFVLFINIGFLLVLPYDTIQREENFTTIYFIKLGVCANRVVINILPLYGSLIGCMVRCTQYQKDDYKNLYVFGYIMMSILYSILDYKKKFALFITQYCQVFFYTLCCLGLLILRFRGNVDRSYKNHIIVPVLGSVLGIGLLILFLNNLT
jgi:amino acid transporter